MILAYVLNLYHFVLNDFFIIRKYTNMNISSFTTKIFYGGVSGFETDCPCGVLCRGLTIDLRYVSHPFWNLVLNRVGL